MAGGYSASKTGSVFFGDHSMGKVMNRFTLSFIALLVSVLVLGTSVDFSFAGSFEDGQRKWTEGDYAGAMLLLRPLADQGDTSAEYLVGLMYANAQGFPEDGAEGARWFEKAAKGGNPNAAYALCQNFAVGRIGAPPDLVKSYVWCDIAAAAYTAAKRTEKAGQAVSMRDLVGKKLKEDEMALARKQIASWQEAH
jgi:hypothetical protein